MRCGATSAAGIDSDGPPGRPERPERRLYHYQWYSCMCVLCSAARRVGASTSGFPLSGKLYRASSPPCLCVASAACTAKRRVHALLPEGSKASRRSALCKLWVCAVARAAVRRRVRRALRSCTASWLSTARNGRNARFQTVRSFRVVSVAPNMLRTRDRG